MIDRNGRVWLCTLLLVIGTAGGPVGCGTLARWTGGHEAPSGDERSYLEVAYVSGPDADPAKHRLDFYRPDPDAVPADSRWPVLIFLHGGEWAEDDRADTADEDAADRSLARFFSSQGVGTAIIRYRLQPDVKWRDQVEDVGRAARYVKDRVAKFGGDPDAIFLAGHSAGAHLAARFGLGPVARQKVDVHPCGLILVSGAAYDLSDQETYSLGADRTFFEERFLDESDDWETNASVVNLVHEDSPPSLIVFAADEPEKLKHQSQLLANAYGAAGARAWIGFVPGDDHERIFLTLSDDDRSVGRAMLKFIRDQACSPSAFR